MEKRELRNLKDHAKTLKGKKDAPIRKGQSPKKQVIRKKPKKEPTDT